MLGKRMPFHPLHPRPRVLNHPPAKVPQVRAASLVFLAYGGIHSLTSWPPCDTQIPIPPSRYIHYLIRRTRRIRPRLISVIFICRHCPRHFPMAQSTTCKLATRHFQGWIHLHTPHLTLTLMPKVFILIYLRTLLPLLWRVAPCLLVRSAKGPVRVQRDAE